MKKPKNMDIQEKKRIDELDYLRCVMIVLMVVFHLVYIESLYPYAKRVIYTFHMPVFLIISGYLTSFEKSPMQFLRNILWLFVPYVIMESGYIWMCSLLPVGDHIDNLTVALFFDKLFLHPIGPYWFFHTLILCGLTCFAVFRICQTKLLSRCILCGVIFACFSCLGMLSLPKALYFLAGVVIHYSGKSFLDVFQSSFLSLIVLVLLIIHPDNLSLGVAGGVLIVYFVISFCLSVFPYIRGRFRRVMLFLGRSTLPIFVFSPVFTILCKFLIPYFEFDKTGMLFLLVSLTVCISGSLAIGWTMDKLHISPLFFGREKIVVSSGEKS